MMSMVWHSKLSMRFSMDLKARVQDLYLPHLHTSSHFNNHSIKQRFQEIQVAKIALRLRTRGHLLIRWPKHNFKDCQMVIKMN